MDYPEVYAVDFDKTLNIAQKYPELGKTNCGQRILRQEN